MSEPSLQTAQLKACLERLQAGDASAREELLHRIRGRLERLTHAMLRDFPVVRRLADTDDVVQGALLRLSRALDSLQPASTRDFFAVAAVLIRRELVDLARRLRSRKRQGEPHLVSLDHAPVPGEAIDPPAADESWDDLERWRRFHEAADALPPAEREVVSLRFYHGYTPAEIAALLGVTDRTVRRHWADACLLLVESLGDDLPCA